MFIPDYISYNCDIMHIQGETFTFLSLLTYAFLFYFNIFSSNSAGSKTTPKGPIGVWSRQVQREEELSPQNRPEIYARSMVTIQ